MTDINTQVDIDPNTADDPNILTNTETNAGTRNAGSEEEPHDIRSLLNKAVAGELKTDEAGRVRSPNGQFAPKQAETRPILILRRLRRTQIRPLFNSSRNTSRTWNRLNRRRLT
jgi:hypothetical protein